MRIVYWGTYDTGKPRNRILIIGLRQAGADVIECHREIWGGCEDKSEIRGLWVWTRLLGRWLAAYPSLVWRYLWLPRHDAVVVGYPGQFDVLILWPLAKLRGVPVVWDAFLSLYDTVVNDRKLVRQNHPLAWFLYIWEWVSCHAADLIVLDSAAQVRYFCETFTIAPDKLGDVFVGAETKFFWPLDMQFASDRAGFTVLFYGQFIPLHGVWTIVEAARLLETEQIDWVLIGSGQEAPAIRAAIEGQPLPRLRWIPWSPYGELVTWVHRADVCLGIFGDSGKASRVIPNKVFQALAAGRPVITRDSPAIRELVDEGSRGVWLIPPADPKALAQAVLEARNSRTTLCHNLLHRGLVSKFDEIAVGKKFLELIAARIAAIRP